MRQTDRQTDRLRAKELAPNPYKYQSTNQWMHLLVFVSTNESLDWVSNSSLLSKVSEVLMALPSGSNANGAGAFRFIFSCCESWLYASASASKFIGLICNPPPGCDVECRVFRGWMPACASPVAALAGLCLCCCCWLGRSSFIYLQQKGIFITRNRFHTWKQSFELRY